MTRALTVAEAFCGAGGLALGLDSAGFTHRWAADGNRDAVATFRRALWPDAEVQMITGEESIGEVDLLAGGPPCQPFSSAGLRRGQWDARDGFPVMLALAKNTLPRAVLIENVAGFLTAQHTAYREGILNELTLLGYTVGYRLLNAADYGVPQQRRRVFIVGVADAEDAANFAWPTPTHSLAALVHAKFIAGTQPGGDHPPSRQEQAMLRVLDPARTPRAGTKAHAAYVEAWADVEATRPWRTVRDALGSLPGAPGRAHTSAKHPAAQLDRPAHAVVAGTHGRGGGHDIVDIGRGGTYGTGARSKSLCYPATRPDEPSHTVQAGAEAKNSEHAIRIVRNLGAGDGRGSTIDNCAPTVACGYSGQEGLVVVDADSVHQWADAHGRVHHRPDVVLRRLTTREVATLQTFPADWPWQGSKTSVYRQIGNAVPALLGQALGDALYAALR